MVLTSTNDRDEQLAAFCERWVGYGNPDAPVWLVGLEEGGAGTWSEVEGRLHQWEGRGRPRFSRFRPDPVPADHRWFGERPRLQPYWARLARLVLAIEGREVTTETVRRYQQTELAAADGSAALLELLPLPSPATSQWLYGEHSDIPWLASRNRYRQRVLPDRVRLLHRLIDSHSPDALVFVGATARESWQQVAGQQLGDAPVHLPSGAVAMVVKHPAAFGVTNAHYQDAGATIAATLGGAAGDE